MGSPSPGQEASPPLSRDIVLYMTVGGMHWSTYAEKSTRTLCPVFLFVRQRMQEGPEGCEPRSLPDVRGTAHPADVAACVARSPPRTCQ